MASIVNACDTSSPSHRCGNHPNMQFRPPTCTPKPATLAVTYNIANCQRMDYATCIAAARANSMCSEEGLPGDRTHAFGTHSSIISHKIHPQLCNPARCGAFALLCLGIAGSGPSGELCVFVATFSRATLLLVLWSSGSFLTHSSTVWKTPQALRGRQLPLR